MIDFVTALLAVAIAGLFLLFARDWSVRVVGGILLLPRLLVAPLSQGEVLMFGCVVAAAVSHIVYQRTFGAQELAEEAPAAPEPAEPDDVSEPTTCVACRGPIPAGADTCPRCGWSYTVPRA